LSSFEDWLSCASVNPFTVLITVSKILHEMAVLPRGQGLEIVQDFEPFFVAAVAHCPFWLS